MVFQQHHRPGGNSPLGCAIFWFFGFLAMLLHPSPVTASTTDAVEAVTGAHTKVVWMRDVGDGMGTFGWGPHFLLMGYDSRDGLGERVILDKPSNYFRPLLTPDGEKIIFTNQDENSIYEVRWDGTGLRKIGPGLAAALWKDPESGETWIYGKDEVARTTNSVLRFPLTHPDRKEIVWSKTESQVTTPGSLQIAADGKTMAMNMPWPVSGVAVVPDGNWSNLATGCWPGIAPDHSYLTWTFDGAHRNLLFHDPFADEQWRVAICTAPGVNGSETYHPRWSNHPRYFTMTGPYNSGKGRGGLSAGGSQVEVYVGKFSEDFRTVESWVQVTHDDKPDFFPDVWIADGPSVTTAFNRPQEPNPFLRSKPQMEGAWPANHDGLVFLWRNQRMGNREAREGLFEGPAQPEVRGGARFGRNWEMELRGGSIAFPGWGERISQACQQSGAFSLEITFAPGLALEFGPKRIVTLSTDRKNVNFFLGQEGENAVLCLRTSNAPPEGERLELFPLKVGERIHAILSYSQGVLTCYVNGEQVFQSADLRGDLSNWNPDARLLFGDSWSGRRQWTGYVEGVAFYDRKIDPEEASHKASLYHAILSARKTPASWEISGEVVEQRPAPDLENILPYRRALVINTYRATPFSPEENGNGTPGEDGLIRVAEWALLDGDLATSYRINREGTSRPMRIEKLEDHPQLESERLIGDAEVLDETIYVEVYPGG
jgi:hypothetical protein